MKLRKYMEGEKGEIYLLSCFFILSFIVTYFYFYKDYFKVGFDDIVHFQVFESIANAFENHRLPPLVNFIGFSANGESFNGMYPWVTSLIFVIPRLLINNVILALYFSMSILLFITLFNCCLLLKNFTNKKSVLFFGSVIYSFNQYNLINIYNRGALGEALGFAFLPLVFLGIIKIWQKEYRVGSLFLALGMSLVINSHILTTVICCLYLIIFELFRLLLRKLDFKEIKSIIVAAFITIVASAYTLSNIIKLSLKNDLTTPWRNILTLDWNQFVAGSTKATLAFQTYNYNFGMFILIIMIVMVVMLFRSCKNTSWKKWIIISCITFVLTFSWVPYKYIGLTKSPLGTIQFASRMLNFVILFLVIGVTIFIDKNYRNNYKKGLIIYSLLMLLFAVFTEINYVNNKKASYNLTNENINKYVYGSNYAESDYSLKDKHNHNWSVIYKSEVFPLKDNLHEYYNGVQFNVYSSQRKPSYIRFLTYNGIKYEVYVNNKKIMPNYSLGLLRVPLNKGINTLNIISKAQLSEYIFFVISIISTIMIILTLIMKKEIFDKKEVP